MTQAPVVVLIHGTFARHVSDLWARPDGAFALQLKKELPDGTEVESFNWFSEEQHLAAKAQLAQSQLPTPGPRGAEVGVGSLPGQAMGPNSETQRRASGQQLFERLRQLEAHGRPYHLVAHSHGGSVIWHALCRSVAAGQQLNGLRSWSTFGTPFLTFAPSPISVSRFLAWSLVFVTAALLSRSMLYELAFRPGDGARAILARLGWLDVFLLTVAAATLLAGLCAPIVAAVRWFSVRRNLMARGPDVEGKAADWYRSRARHYWHDEDEVMFLMRLSFAAAPDVTPATALFRIRHLRRASDEYIWRTLGNFLHGNDIPGLSLSSVGRCPAVFANSRNALGLDGQRALLVQTGHAAGETLAAIRQQLSNLSDLPTWKQRMDVIQQLFKWNEVIHTAYYRVPAFAKLLATEMAAAPTESMPVKPYRAGPVPRALERTLTGMIVAACLVGGAGCIAIFRDALLAHTNLAQDFEIRSEIRKLRYLGESYRPGRVVGAALSQCTIAPADDFFAGVGNIEVRAQVAWDLARMLGRAGWLHHMSSLQQSYERPLSPKSTEVPLPAIIRGERFASDTGCATALTVPTINDLTTARLWSLAVIGMAEGGHTIDAQIALNVLRYYSEPRREAVSPRLFVIVEDSSGGLLSLLRRAYLKTPGKFLSGDNPSLHSELQAMTGYDAAPPFQCTPGYLLSDSRFAFGAAISGSINELGELLGAPQRLQACLSNADEHPKILAWTRRMGQTSLADDIERHAPAPGPAAPPVSETTPGFALAHRCKQRAADPELSYSSRLLTLVSIYRDFVARTGPASAGWPTECTDAGFGSEQGILEAIFRLDRELLADGARPGSLPPPGLSQAFLDVRELAIRSDRCERSTTACAYGVRALDAATRYLPGAAIRDGVAKRDELAGLLARHWQWHRETKQAVASAIAVERPPAALNNLTHITLARTRFAAPASARATCRALLLDPAVTVASCP